MVRLFVFSAVLNVASAGLARNVLLITVDDLRPELGIFHPWADDSETILTPSLDALAGRSTLFSRPVVQIALCAPSRTSFLTSLRPDKTKIYTIGPFFRNTTDLGEKAVTSRKVSSKVDSMSSPLERSFIRVLSVTLSPQITTCTRKDIA